ncbi:MAG: MFS transporter [Planctomycetota bacterium]
MSNLSTTSSPPVAGLVEKDGRWYRADGARVWRAGTLVYDKRGLFRLMFFLFIGQFTFILEVTALPMMLPLLFEQRAFSASQMGWLGIFAPLGALLLFPILGYFSDRTRTKMGRRRPYDLFTAPFWFVGLLIAPFVDSFFAMMLALALIGFAGAANNVLTGFYNDVVPPELMGRFSAGMRLVGSLGVLGFQFGLLRFFDDHPEAVFIGLASVAFVGEMLMIFMVKEGEYPPPEPTRGFSKEIYDYLQEGFANRYVVFLWLTLGVTALGGPVMGFYFIRYFTDEEHGLGLSSAQLGTLTGIGTALGLGLYPFAGWIIDRVGPKLMWGLCGGLVGVLQIAMFFFAHDYWSISALYVVFAAVNAVLTVALLPVMFAFIPQSKFGQLNGANQIVTRGLAIAGTLGCAWLITTMGEQYRYAFLFGGVAYLLTPVFLWLMLKQPYPYQGMPTSMHPDGRRGAKASQPDTPAPTDPPGA